MEKNVQKDFGKLIQDFYLKKIWNSFLEKTLMMNVSVDELELFASSVLKQIEIIRKSYGEQIKMLGLGGCA